MTSSRRFALASLLAVLTVGSVAAAQQQPSAADLETARGLYKQGKSLEAKGDDKGALDKLTAAHALGRTPLTGIELARLQARLGMIVEAREVCLSIGRTQVAADETQRSADARTEAAKLAEALKAKVATLVVKITPPGTGAHVTLTIDEQPVPDVALNEPHKVNPGKHVVSARAYGGQPVGAQVELGTAETKEISLSPPAAPVTAAPPPPVEPPAAVVVVAPPASGGASTGLMIAGFSAVGVFGLAGAVLGANAMSATSQLTANCPDSRCAPAQHDTLTQARTSATLSTVSFAVAGLGAAVGIVGVALRPGAGPRDARARITPEFGLGTVGVSGAF